MSVSMNAVGRVQRVRIFRASQYLACGALGLALGRLLLEYFVGAGGMALGYGALSISGLATGAILCAGLGVLRDGPRWRRLAGLLVIGLLALGLLVIVPPPWLLRLIHSPTVPLYAETSQQVVALSIDDSLDTVATPLILEVLDEHDVRATFFVLSDSVPGNEALLERILAAGHELGNHQTHDVRGWRMGHEEFAEDVRACGEVLKPLAPVRWFRPGGGITTRAMREEAKRQGYQIVLGSVFPFDSHLPSASFAARYIEQRVFPGAIIVLHDGPARGDRTAEALAKVLPRLKQAGYHVRTVGELLAAPGASAIPGGG